MKADLAIHTLVLGVPAQYESVALMPSHKMDFYCCANRGRFLQIQSHILDSNPIHQYKVFLLASFLRRVKATNETTTLLTRFAYNMTLY